jgi:hypothetical protein
VAPDCTQPLLYNVHSVGQVSATHVSACTIRVKVWLSARSEGMTRKECKTCLNNPQSTPSFDWLAQPTHTTDPIKQCVVLTGTPILVANRTVNAAPSSIVNPLEVKQVNYISHACNISTSWGRKMTICLYLVLSTCTMLLHYAHVPCCFIMHMHHAASLRSEPCCFITHMHHAASLCSAPCCFIMHMHHVASLRTCIMLPLCACTRKKKPSDISNTRSMHKPTAYNTEGHRL